MPRTRQPGSRYTVHSSLAAVSAAGFDYVTIAQTVGDQTNNRLFRRHTSASPDVDPVSDPPPSTHSPNSQHLFEPSAFDAF